MHHGPNLCVAVPMYGSRSRSTHFGPDLSVEVLTYASSSRSMHRSPDLWVPVPIYKSRCRPTIAQELGRKHQARDFLHRNIVYFHDIRSPSNRQCAAIKPSYARHPPFLRKLKLHRFWDNKKNFIDFFLLYSFFFSFAIESVTHFLVACTRLYKPLCPSVGLSVGLSVCLSVCRLALFSFYLYFFVSFPCIFRILYLLLSPIIFYLLSIVLALS